MALGLEWLDEHCYEKMYRKLDIRDKGAIRFQAPKAKDPTKRRSPQHMHYRQPVPYANLNAL